MTPAARLQAVIELLTEIDDIARPADAVMSAYFRNRRYIGSKDRSNVAQTTYAILRRHARLSWWIERAGHRPTPRARTLAYALLEERRNAGVVLEMFSGGKFAPERMTENELALVGALDTHTLEHPEMPEAVRVECPDWAEGPIRASLGDRFAVEMEKLLDAAPLDLRINPLKANQASAIKALAKAQIVAEVTQWSPFGLRVKGRPPLGGVDAFKDGLVEIQDEGSQLVALAVAAKPGHQVVDFCAGAGGKTLAIAAMMKNKGRVVACDVLAGRLKRAAERFRRAGLHNIEAHPLTSERDPWVKRHKRKFDRVLVDAPCSGTGTWRRNPDSRWRQLGPGLSELVPLQANILDSAARLVKPGGRLIYATCSMLFDENEGQIAHFLETHPEFTVKPVADVWAEEAYGPVPCDGPYLRLTPARHDTDGFFAAILDRKAEEVAAETTDEAADDAEAAEFEVADLDGAELGEVDPQDIATATDA
ncbi:RsmB/NOP family class I SAM-dependent RNA methyltransferase [Azospirillum cavernae]|uniref:RsmB/NOP family class I SAM-dependent RNA methyltransferase n=1 Tax=Azospirillum cavernae TaxID=2320860 RepID=A0A418W5T3_9PROT|nr:RsmB/NOP family class I SAM-dependent RNA methyltransferase [Azospirillum cavernae]RJF85298.1 RsmB/NOP family class I SAM-dependent RNA methyltransferase [Azospirillum cavernae]